MPPRSRRPLRPAVAPCRPGRRRWSPAAGSAPTGRRVRSSATRPRRTRGRIVGREWPGQPGGGGRCRSPGSARSPRRSGGARRRARTPARRPGPGRWRCHSSWSWVHGRAAGPRPHQCRYATRHAIRTLTRHREVRDRNTVRVAGDDRFVGRQDELDLLRRRLADARTGSGSVIVVSGPAGIGKSRLLEEFVAEAAPTPIVWGNAVADPGAPALWPWTRALRWLPGPREALAAVVAGGTPPAERP